MDLRLTLSAALVVALLGCSSKKDSEPTEIRVELPEVRLLLRSIDVEMRMVAAFAASYEKQLAVVEATKEPVAKAAEQEKLKIDLFALEYQAREVAKTVALLQVVNSACDLRLPENFFEKMAGASFAFYKLSASALSRKLFGEELMKVGIRANNRAKILSILRMSFLEGRPRTRQAIVSAAATAAIAAAIAAYSGGNERLESVVRKHFCPASPAKAG